MKPIRSIRMAGIILGRALVLGLSGCSATWLGYNGLPQLLDGGLDGHADFSDARGVRRPR